MSLEPVFRFRRRALARYPALPAPTAMASSTLNFDPDRYHLVVGAYTAKTIEIEQTLNMIIASFFGVRDPVWVTFQNWVLGPLNLKAKIEILQSVRNTHPRFCSFFDSG
jgi:hypothetical protein